MPDTACAMARCTASHGEVDACRAVRASSARSSGGAAPAAELARATWRAQAERMWPVSAERPLERRPGSRARSVHPVKRALRPAMRWYVEPLAAAAASFNDATLKLIDALFEELDRRRSADRDEPDGRLIAELEERLLRARAARPGAGVAPQTVAAQPAAAAASPTTSPSRARMRGSTASCPRAPARRTSTTSATRAPVLDIGCGRGEFLALLREAGRRGARGRRRRGHGRLRAREGLDVEQADALAYLEALDGRLARRHLRGPGRRAPAAARRSSALLELAAREARDPGGVLVAETINPLSPLALRNYFADLTHAQPLVPETLALLARQAGFREVETRFLNEPGRAARGARRSDDRRERSPAERAAVRAARLRDPRAHDEDRRLPPAGAVRARRRRDLRGRPRRGAARARARGGRSSPCRSSGIRASACSTQAFLWRLLDLTEADGRPIDLVIATKFPLLRVRHPNKVVWLLHQFRQAYELDRTELGAVLASRRTTARCAARVHRLDRRRARRGAQALRDLAERRRPARARRPGSTPRCSRTRRRSSPTAATRTATSCSRSAGSTGRSGSTCCSRRRRPTRRSAASSPATGPDRERLERLARTRPRRPREFAGRVDDAELADLYARCLRRLLRAGRRGLRDGPVRGVPRGEARRDDDRRRRPARRRRDRETGLVVRADAPPRSPRRARGSATTRTTRATWGQAGQGARRAGHVGPRDRPAARMKVAYYSPLPPSRSGDRRLQRAAPARARGADRGRASRGAAAVPPRRRPTSRSTTSATTRRRTAGSSRRCAAARASSSCTSSCSTTSSPG